MGRRKQPPPAPPSRALLEFTVEGEPQTWKRTNFWKGRKLTPAAQRVFQRQVQAAAKAAGAKPEAGWVFLVIWSLRSRRLGDWDNFGKNVSDALNGVAYRDDAQVVVGVVVKGLDPARPRTVVRVVYGVAEPGVPPASGIPS